MKEIAEIYEVEIVHFYISTFPSPRDHQFTADDFLIQKKYQKDRIFVTNSFIPYILYF